MSSKQSPLWKTIPPRTGSVGRHNAPPSPSSAGGARQSAMQGTWACADKTENATSKPQRVVPGCWDATARPSRWKHVLFSSTFFYKINTIIFLFVFNKYCLIFLDYTVQRRHSTRTHTHPYEHTYANPTPMNTFEGLSQHARTLTPMNTRTQTLPLWASSKDWDKFRIKCRTQDLNPGWEPPNQWPLPLRREPLGGL